ncbi:MAG: nuclear transport factor 2 family protein [Gemmataceae bacterium]|nr:nuclear transport factor 2 family protein [Gemmataceae bacterium]
MSSGPRSGSSSNAPLIILGVLGVLILGGGVLVIVCLAAITMIGTRSEMTFQTVGASLGPVSTGSEWPTTPRVDPAIRRMLDAQVAAWNQGDLVEFMDGYWNSPELTFYSGNEPKQGWQETLERYRQRYGAKDKEMGKLRFGELDIEMLAPDRALVRGRWHLDLDKAKEEKEGLFTLIVRKFPQGWRITHDHTSGN